jgi:O-antigen/teichoic acid export membrane protein
MPTQVKSASGRILHNSFWYGLETVIETFLFMGTSIAVARYLGPEKLGHYSYINLFVTVVTRTSATGVASATRKYMSEFLAAGEPGTARAVYYLAYRYQLIGALTITALGLFAVLLFGEPGFRLMSVILILSITPGVMSWVPANANQAFEDVSQNTISAFCYMFTYVTIIGLTLYFKWDLIGIASAMLIGRTVEVLLRTFPLHARLRTMPLTLLDKPLTERIRRFCLEGIGIQLLMSVVWDRTEVLFLRFFSGFEQIAFYSISFGLANNLLVFPNTFGNATGITLMVEAGRDPKRVKQIVSNGARFLMLVVLPVNLGAAAITAELVMLAYTRKYGGAVPVLMIAAVLAIPRAVQVLPETLLKTADRQKQLLIWLGITGAVNILLDWILIPRFGAVGAAWGNGLGQTFGVVAMWVQARRFYDFDFPWWSTLRLTFAALAMAATTYGLERALPGLPGLILGLIAAPPLYILLVRLTHVLDSTDRARLTPIGDRLPRRMRSAYRSVIQFATPSGE